MSSPAPLQELKHKPARRGPSRARDRAAKSTGVEYGSTPREPRREDSRPKAMIEVKIDEKEVERLRAVRDSIDKKIDELEKTQDTYAGTLGMLTAIRSLLQQDWDKWTVYASKDNIYDCYELQRLDMVDTLLDWASAHNTMVEQYGRRYTLRWAFTYTVERLDKRLGFFVRALAKSSRDKDGNPYTKKWASKEAARVVEVFQVAEINLWEEGEEYTGCVV